jgi:CheY-like chemotaxis protein
VGDSFNAPVSKSAEREPNRYRVLVVEDEMCLRLILEDIVTDAGGIVLLAATLDEAMTLAQTDRLDAALLDIKLNKDGVFPAAYLLRERGVPFAFLTACDTSILPPDLADSPMLKKPHVTGNNVLNLLMHLLASKP